MRSKAPGPGSKRAVWLVLLCALLLQSIFPVAARPLLAGSNGITCAADQQELESGGGQHDPSHDLCCTVACASCCAVFAALLGGILVLAPRRPSRIGIVEDQLAAASSPLDLYFAARGPPHP